MTGKLAKMASHYEPDKTAFIPLTAPRCAQMRQDALRCAQILSAAPACDMKQLLGGALRIGDFNQVKVRVECYSIDNTDTILMVLLWFTVLLLFRCSNATSSLFVSLHSSLVSFFFSFFFCYAIRPIFPVTIKHFNFESAPGGYEESHGVQLRVPFPSLMKSRGALHSSQLQNAEIKGFSV